MASSNLYPMLFAPLYKDYLWGGDAIRRRFHRDIPIPVCAESWELADRPEGQSVVTNGPLAGTTLRDLLRTQGRDVLNSNSGDTAFPLLIKILDARERLSVQVHPDNESAARHGGEPKTEMWVVLDAAPGAKLYAGLQPGTTPDAMRRALASRSVEKLLPTIPVAAGDAVFIAGGRIHAIGEGCLILEVQQNSNTTYRLYDWDRVDKAGKARELHIDDALAVTNWDDRAEARIHPTPLASGANLAGERLADCPYFRVDRWRLSTTAPLPRDHTRCDILFVMTGSVRVSAGNVSVDLPSGTTCLIPASCPPPDLTPLTGPASLLQIVPG